MSGISTGGMMLGGWRLRFWMLSLLIAAPTVGIMVLLWRSRPPNQDVDYDLGSLLVALAVAAVTAIAWLWTKMRPSPAAQRSLEQAADELADQLSGQWRQAAAERRLINPEPIPVRWRWSRQQVAGSIARAVEGEFKPLPGMAAVIVEDLQSGTLEDLLGLYGGLVLQPDLVILGVAA